MINSAKFAAYTTSSRIFIQGNTDYWRTKNECCFCRCVLSSIHLSACVYEVCQHAFYTDVRREYDENCVPGVQMVAILKLPVDKHCHMATSGGLFAGEVGNGIYSERRPGPYLVLDIYVFDPRQ